MFTNFNTVMKGNAKKVRRLYQNKVLAGFAGGTADARVESAVTAGARTSIHSPLLSAGAAGGGVRAV